MLAVLTFAATLPPQARKTGRDRHRGAINERVELSSPFAGATSGVPTWQQPRFYLVADSLNVFSRCRPLPFHFQRLSLGFGANIRITRQHPLAAAALDRPLICKIFEIGNGMSGVRLPYSVENRELNIQRIRDTRYLVFRNCASTIGRYLKR